MYHSTQVPHLLTHIAHPGFSGHVCRRSHKEIHGDVQDNGSCHYQTVQIRAGETNNSAIKYVNTVGL